jgi:hypothetical protein
MKKLTNKELTKIGEICSGFENVLETGYDAHGYFTVDMEDYDDDKIFLNIKYPEGDQEDKQFDRSDLKGKDVSEIVEEI